LDYRRNAMRNVRASERSVCGEAVPSRSCGETAPARRFCETDRPRMEEMQPSCGCEREHCAETWACDLDRERSSECEARVLDTNLVGAPLAMVYSPFQRFDDLFEPEEALCHGTLFRELYKPFFGSRRGV